MRIFTMKISITFIIAIMGFIISPATIAETQLDMLDSSAKDLVLNYDNLIIDNENIIKVRGGCHRDCRRYKRRCLRRCDRRYGHSYRYDRCARRCYRESRYCHRDCRYDRYRY
jgi:hypothetical protein